MFEDLDKLVLSLKEQFILEYFKFERISADNDILGNKAWETKTIAIIEGIRAQLDYLEAQTRNDVSGKVESKIFDNKIDALCYSIIKMVDNNGVHMDFIIDDNAEESIALIDMAIEKLEKQGYIKIFKDVDYSIKHPHYFRVYPSTYKGDGTEEDE
jgi:hypothetical protein